MENKINELQSLYRKALYDCNVEQLIKEISSSRIGSSLYENLICSFIILYLVDKDNKENKDVRFIIKNQFQDLSIVHTLKQTYENKKYIIDRYKYKIQSDYLLALIIFLIPIKNSEEKYTPTSINQLVIKLLDFQDDDYVLAIEPGIGNFLIDAYISNKMPSYSGMESIYSYFEILNFRNLIGDFNFTLINQSLLLYKSKDLYNKVYSNHPLSIVRKKKDFITSNEEINKFIMKFKYNIYFDWLYNYILVNSITESGKAISLMITGTLDKKVNLNIQKYFIENGYIETIILLPANLYQFITIETTLIVFSKNNKLVNMVDARSLTSRLNREKYYFCNDDIDLIINLIGKNSDFSRVVENSEIISNYYYLNPLKYLIES